MLRKIPAKDQKMHTKSSFGQLNPSKKYFLPNNGPYDWLSPFPCKY